METLKFGAVTISWDGDAYLHSEGLYRAQGLGDDGQDYVIEWSTTSAWDAANAEAATNRADGDYDSYPSLLDDESNACDWDNPSTIRLV